MTSAQASAQKLELATERSLRVANTTENYGEVFTKPWVVNLILDLAGYTTGSGIASKCVVEPSCGTGAFLVPTVRRLTADAKRSGVPLSVLAESVRAFDLKAEHVNICRSQVAEVLVDEGASVRQARSLAESWIHERDFLLDVSFDRAVDFVIGNPPYVRHEEIGRNQLAAYRSACPTMSGRADIYVGFFEKSLRSLTDGGVLGFICADRWMRNAYGSGLRRLIAEAWSVEVLLQMHGVDAFEEQVDAYPAITMIRRSIQTSGPIVAEADSNFDERSAAAFVEFASQRNSEASNRQSGFSGSKLEHWYSGTQGWPSGSPARLKWISDLEDRYLPIGDSRSGVTVGIGVATGADKVFLVDETNGVEPERLLPIALPTDLRHGVVDWSGKWLVNPWDSNGLVDLEDWPGLALYLNLHRSKLEARHTARTGNWFKTIDRVNSGLLSTPKLYIPDMNDRLAPVLDRGETYPHHNLYWVASETWDLSSLGGVLMSDVANTFVEAYSVRMRGGFLRFQAQYLKRICIPASETVSRKDHQLLAKAFASRDVEAANEVAFRAYGIDQVPT